MEKKCICNKEFAAIGRPPREKIYVHFFYCPQSPEYEDWCKENRKRDLIQYLGTIALIILATVVYLKIR